MEKGDFEGWMEAVRGRTGVCGIAAGGRCEGLGLCLFGIERDG